MFASCFANVRQLWRDNPGLFYHRGLFWTFWLSLATFPVGYGAREVFPLVALCFLLGYYRYCWRESVLARLPIRWIFVCPLLMSFIGIIFSCDMWASLLHVGRGINKGFILPFIAMECVGNEKDLRRLVWASAIACFWEGLDGIWQATTGHDFIFGYPLHSGRLTGSLGDYPIGNYIALALIPAWGIWHMLRQRRNPLGAALFCAVLLTPGLFLLNGAATRSGMLSLACALALWGLLQMKKLASKQILLALGMFTLVFAGFWAGQYISSFGKADRLGIETVSDDGRWGYWQTALKIVHAHPYFGAGAGRFRDTFERMGIAPAKDAINASHPHNLYLDILYAHGYAGFSLGMLFLLGVPCWCFKYIYQGMRLEKQERRNRLFWHLGLCFWLGYIGWLINGIFGHDFYRMWYLALAMSYLGIMLGVVVNGQEQTPTSS